MHEIAGIYLDRQTCSINLTELPRRWALAEIKKRNNSRHRRRSRFNGTFHKAEPGRKKSGIFRDSSLATIPTQSVDCVKVAVAAVDIGVVVKAIGYFDRFFQPAESVEMSIPVVSPEMLRPHRYRGFDRLFDDDEQFFIFFSIHHAPRSGRFLRLQEYFGNFGRKYQGSFTRIASPTRSSPGRNTPHTNGYGAGSAEVVSIRFLTIAQDCGLEKGDGTISVTQEV